MIMKAPMMEEKASEAEKTEEAADERPATATGGWRDPAQVVAAEKKSGEAGERQKEEQIEYSMNFEPEELKLYNNLFL